jgi:hypothetical protein|tara:strand:+ start:7139 stop:8464 length:1326 start_codon:yes stop_codon:yes gene_type:complete
MSPEEFLKKFKSHADAKKALFEYYAAFQISAVESDPVAARTSSLGFSLGSAGWVNTSEDMLRASRRFSDLLTKTLGARFGDEKDLSDLIRKAAHNAVSSNQTEKQFLDAVTDDIVDILSQDFEIFLPNRLVYLGPKITPLKIGNVKVLKLSDLEKEIQPVVAKLQTKYTNMSVEFDYEQHRAIFKQASIGIEVPSSAMMWAVKARASKTHLYEEALWQIGIATSLMRLSSSKWDGRIPSFRDIEPSPVVQDRYAGDNALVRNGQKLSYGGSKFASAYIVDGKISKDLRAKKTQSIFDEVFAHKPGRLGEQVFNALGWLTKGRQALDRSERLLYFFTAIEAILTRNNKDSPVIDTIARHGSVMLAASIEKRPGVAKRFKDLYAHRSATVHRGTRNASANAVANAHYLATLLVFVALKKGNLSEKHDTFSDALSAASYGTVWP